jgi:hypothetical protein
MLLDLQFKSNRNECDRNCIRNATESAPIPTQKFRLPAGNGSLVEVNVTSKLTEGTFVSINYKSINCLQF